jgi:hypothetical protein
MEKLRKVTMTLLDPENPSWSLRPEILELTTILSEAQTVRPGQQDHISDGESRTSSGLALSPTMAAMCADDFVRTVKFIRGLYGAVVDQRKQVSDRPVRVLYIGCGPYATLAVPLMSVLSPAEATFTLLDVHSESILSARSIVDSLNLVDSVTGYETRDAGSYHICPDEPPDIIILEIMQACLKKEPQVAITRHLLKQAPLAVLIPEEVSIGLVLINPAREFDWNGQGNDSGPIQRDRIPIDSVFVLNRATAQSWEAITGDRLPAGRLKLPGLMEKKYEPMLLTTIRVHGDHILKDYESGLTGPRSPSVNGSLKPGATIEFHYELGADPQLVGEVCEPPD